MNFERSTVFEWAVPNKMNQTDFHIMTYQHDHVIILLRSFANTFWEQNKDTTNWIRQIVSINTVSDNFKTTMTSAWSILVLFGTCLCFNVSVKLSKYDVIGLRKYCTIRRHRESNDVIEFWYCALT